MGKAAETGECKSRLRFILWQNVNSVYTTKQMRTRRFSPVGPNPLKWRTAKLIKPPLQVYVAEILSALQQEAHASRPCSIERKSNFVPSRQKRTTRWRNSHRHEVAQRRAPAFLGMRVQQRRVEATKVNHLESLEIVLERVSHQEVISSDYPQHRRLHLVQPGVNALQQLRSDAAISGGQWSRRRTE